MVLVVAGMWHWGQISEAGDLGPSPYVSGRKSTAFGPAELSHSKLASETEMSISLLHWRP